MVLTEHLPPTNGLGFKSCGRRHMWVDCWFSPLFRIFFFLKKINTFTYSRLILIMNARTRFNPMSAKQIPKSAIRGIFVSGIRNPENFACGIRNPGLWNPEYSLRNQESHYRLESRIQAPLKKIQNPRRTVIPLHAVRTIKHEFLRTP